MPQARHLSCTFNNPVLIFTSALQIHRAVVSFQLPQLIDPDTPEDAKIMKEEIFGPVITIRTFKTEEEGIKLANDTQYGLSGECAARSETREGANLINTLQLVSSPLPLAVPCVLLQRSSPAW